MTLADLKTKLQKSAFAFPLAVLVAGLMLTISEGAYYGAESQLSTLVTLGQARLEVMRTVNRVTDAEAGQRGYLLTGRPEYLAPYHFANADAERSLATLQRLYKPAKFADARTQSLLLAQSIDAKLSELKEVLRLHNEGRAGAATDILMTDIGRNQMEDIRTRSEALLASQNVVIAAGLGNIFDTLMLNRLGVAAMTAISLLVVAMFLRQSRQLERQRGEQRQQIQAERDQLELVVRQRTAELTELTRHLQTAREDERARLARDLHDELGALLTAAKLDVTRMRPKVTQQTPDLLPRLSHLTETLNAGIALKRRIIEDLRPSTLDQLGLVASLEVLCREFGEPLGIAIAIDLSPVSLTGSAQLTVFRLVQEALNNIAKYAQASEIRVSLFSLDDRVVARVSDNGRGFDPALIALNTHGLLGMRFRVEAEQGQLRVQSAPGEGTTIEAQLKAQVSEETG